MIFKTKYFVILGSGATFRELMSCRRDRHRTWQPSHDLGVLSQHLFSLGGVPEPFHWVSLSGWSQHIHQTQCCPCTTAELPAVPCMFVIGRMFGHGLSVWRFKPSGDAVLEQSFCFSPSGGAAT